MRDSATRSSRAESGKDCLSLLVPCMFDERLLLVYSDLNRRYEKDGIKISRAYGALPFAHSARKRSELPNVAGAEVVSYISGLASIGIEFSYCLNSPVLSGRDIVGSTRQLLEEMWDAGVRHLTVASPFVIEWLRRRLDHLPFSITLSTIAAVDSVSRLRQAADLGVKEVVLDIRCNRSPALLRAMRSTAAKCNINLALLINEFCGDCLIRGFHYIQQSLDADADWGRSDPFFAEYPYNICEPLFLGSPASILKGYWILPEWLDKYAMDTNITSFKIVGRDCPDIDWHERVLSRYMERATIDGDIMCLAPQCDGTREVVVTGEWLRRTGYLSSFWGRTVICLSACNVECFQCDQYGMRLDGGRNGLG